VLTIFVRDQSKTLTTKAMHMSDCTIFKFIEKKLQNCHKCGIPAPIHTSSRTIRLCIMISRFSNLVDLMSPAYANGDVDVAEMAEPHLNKLIHAEKLIQVIINIGMLVLVGTVEMIH
jgi:hypothetical protein